MPLKHRPSPAPGTAAFSSDTVFSATSPRGGFFINKKTHNNIKTEKSPNHCKPIICGIYKITSISGRVYIGQSEDIYDRIRCYENNYCKNQRKLYYSIRKYGWKNHALEIICICSPKQLNDKEIYFSKLYNSHDKNKGMNIRECGGNRGRHKEESKILMRINHWSKRPRANEIINKIGNSNRGKKRGPVALKNISEAHLGYIMPQYQKDKIAKKNSGKVYNKTKIKIVLNENTGIFYEGINEAANSCHINRNTLGCILRGRKKINTTPFIIT